MNDSINLIFENLDTIAMTEQHILDILFELDSKIAQIIIADICGIFCEVNDLEIKDTYEMMAEIAIMLKEEDAYENLITEYKEKRGE